MASEMTSSEVISNANMGDMCNIFKHLVTWAHQDPVLPRCHRSPSLPQSLMTCAVTNTTDTLCTTNTRQEHHTSQEVALKVSALNSITSQLSHQSMLSKRGVNLHHWHPAANVFFLLGHCSCFPTNDAILATIQPQYQGTCKKHVNLGARMVLRLNQTGYLSTCLVKHSKTKKYVHWIRPATFTWKLFTWKLYLC